MIKSKLVGSEKSEKQEPKSERSEKLNQEKERPKSIQSQLEKENKQIVNKIKDEFQRNSASSTENKQIVSNKITNQSQSISNEKQQEILMRMLTKKEQENVHILFERALDQREKRFRRISRLSDED
jgi:hypothetical protein